MNKSSLLKPIIFGLLFGFQVLSPSPICEVIPGQDLGVAHFSGQLKDADDVEIVVFVHGTVGFESAVYNPLQIAFDKDLSGTKKEKVVRGLYRKADRLHFSDSIIYTEGFFRVDPSRPVFDPELSGNALFPLIRYFDCTARYMDSTKKSERKTVRLYRLFNWSGLLSLSSRMSAGIGLFNALSHEQEMVEDVLLRLGRHQTEVKTKVITHSHGGNTALNAACVECVVSGDSLLDYYKAFYKEKVGESVEQKLVKMIDGLPADIESARSAARYNSDIWLYRPRPSAEQKRVNELVMLACPIQVETWPAAFMPYFEKVANIFSRSDRIQTLDVVSTEARASFNMVRPETAKLGNRLFGSEGKPKLVQVECLYPKMKITPSKVKTLTPGRLSRAFHAKKVWAKNVMKSFFLLQKETFMGTGPSHLEFGFISWTGNTDRLCIRPLPVVVFQPMFADLWSHETDDMVLRLDSGSGGGILSTIFDRNGNRLTSESMAPFFFSGLKNDLIKHIKPLLTGETPENKDPNKKQIDILSRLITS